ncbi:MAG: DegT/DnrJ/EryC1/StrS family aminotransferase [Solirubrobacteraceae bacterium]
MHSPTQRDSSTETEMVRIPITKVFFGEEELRAVQLPLESGWVVQGPYVQEFEDKFSLYTGARHSVATTSCTTALHVAVAALGLEPGDEVIVPAFTWVSTANVIEYMGARPVFCDIDTTTFNIDPTSVEELITERTVGLLPVHLFGLAAEMTPLLEIAGRHGLWVVEDCACSLGGWYRGQHTGTFGEFGCFSFHPRKSITTGEGGMITTQRDNLAELCRSLRDHGAARSDYARHDSSGAFLLSDYPNLGFNFRMTDIQGALGSVQMDRAEALIEQRRRLAAIYDDALREFGWLATPVVPDDCVHGYQAYVCLFQPERATFQNLQRLHAQRNALMATLEENGVSTRQGTHSPILTQFYSTRYELQPESFPRSVMADRLSLALPLYPQMTDNEQQIVVDELRAAFERV